MLYNHLLVANLLIYRCIINLMSLREVVTLRKVELTMEENNKYLTIKKLVETGGNKKRAAMYLNCSIRHINRMIKGYQQEGKSYFIHGNRGRKPVHTFNDKTGSNNNENKK